MGTGTLTVTIDVEARHEPINGRVGAAGEDDRQFTGWLELISALQDILRGPDQDALDLTGACSCRH